MGWAYPSLRTTLPVAGYYARLDAGAAAADQFTADGAQDGTLTNGATRVNDVGLAYSFSAASSQYITGVAPVSGLPITIAAWVNSSSDSAIQTVFSVGNSGALSDYFLIRLRGDLSGDPIEAVWTNSGNSPLVITASSYAINTWMHVAATVSASGGIKLYKNGVLIALDAGALSAASLNVFATGALRRSTVIHFANGLIDDAIVYPIALDATNIGYLASQRGAVYALTSAGGSLINGQSLIRPADSKPYQQLIGV